MQRRLIPYADARDQIRQSDTLIYRRSSLLGSLIARAGRGEWSHAGKAVRWGNRIMVVDTFALRGCTARLLSQEVRRFPAWIDVFRSNRAKFSTAGAANWMIALCGTKYGYLALLRTALYHVPVVRLFLSAKTNDNGDDVPKFPPFCSMAVAFADRIGGGFDPVPRLADRLTEPSDLARSSGYDYVFTLV